MAYTFREFIENVDKIKDEMKSKMPKIEESIYYDDIGDVIEKHPIFMLRRCRVY